MLKLRLDLRDARLAELEPALEIAQRDVEHSTVLRDIDVLAAEKRITLALNICLSSELKESIPDLIVDQVLAEIEKNRHVVRRVLARVAGETLGIRSECLAQVDTTAAKLLEFLPGRKVARKPAHHGCMFFHAARRAVHGIDIEHVLARELASCHDGAQEQVGSPC